MERRVEEKAGLGIAAQGVARNIGGGFFSVGVAEVLDTTVEGKLPP
jgi:hypothetical protein